MSRVETKTHIQSQVDEILRQIQTNPNNPNLYNALGIVLERNGELNRAIEFYKEAIRVDKSYIKAYNNIGAIMYRKKEYKKAVEIFKLALSVDESDVSTYVNIGAACNRAKFYEEGIEYLKKAISLNPKNSGTYTNLGNIYNKIREYNLALKAHKEALKLDPNSAINHANIAISYKNLLKFKEAKRSLKKAISIDPNFVNAHFDLATTYLQLEEYKSGFSEYEWRLKKEEMAGVLVNLKEVLKKPRFSLNLPKKGKTLLLWSEQGYGDMIQFARFAKVLKQKYPSLKIKVEVREALVNLFKEQEFFDEVIRRGESFGEFDYQLPLMSLAHILKSTAKKLPFWDSAYLNIEDENFDLEYESNRLNIGIAWSASATSDSYAERFIGLKHFEPLMRDKQIMLFSLQVGDSKDIKNYSKSEIVDLEPRLRDFKKSALAISKLDLIITSDTSIAHLSGALGKETIVMLPKKSEWRWGVDRSRSIWYKNTKLIRQEIEGEWEAAFEKLERFLKKRLK